MSGKLKHGHARVGFRSPTYKVWAGIRARCNNPRDTNYNYYGGRGIQVCERWDEFTSFLEDMGERPSLKHSIERDNVDGDYCPENCRWATQKEQSLNKRCTIRLTVGGETRTAVEWCKLHGVEYDALFFRYQQGWSDEECVYGRPPQNTLEYMGKTQTIKEWAEELGINYRTLIRRHRDFQWSPEECLMGRSSSNHARSIILMEYKGKVQSMNAWCRELGVHQATAYSRYRKNPSPDYVFSKPRK